jgi:hypothetical protein
MRDFSEIDPDDGEEFTSTNSFESIYEEQFQVLTIDVVDQAMGMGDGIEESTFDKSFWK